MAAFLLLAVFAMFLFEPTSIERYLPLYPFLALMFAAAMAQAGPRSRAVIAVALVLSAASQLWVRSVWASSQADRAMFTRLTPLLRCRSNFANLTWVLTTIDDMSTFVIGDPFHPYNRPRLNLRTIMDLPGSGHLSWSQNFSAGSLAALNEGGEVWVSKRMLAAKPQPDWNWTEGDIAGVRWQDLHDFFSSLEWAEFTPGPDGFARLAPTEKSRSLLAKAAL
jgi:hypothetical protein